MTIAVEVTKKLCDNTINLDFYEDNERVVGIAYSRVDISCFLRSGLVEYYFRNHTNPGPFHIIQAMVPAIHHLTVKTLTKICFFVTVSV